MTAVDPQLSFIVPVRNDAARLRRCLETMSSSVPCEVIVVDNGSSDGSGDVARGAGARVVHLAGSSVATLRNVGARCASGHLLAFVDADHELAPGWTEAAIGLFRDAPDVVAAGAPYQAPPDGTWVQRMYDRLRRRRPGSTTAEWLPSGNLVVRRTAFDLVGGFDTSLETCEDVDICQRLRARGGRLIESDALRSVHVGDPRTLGALFRGELWRGRDNLRVTLRGPLSLRSLASLLLPVAVLGGLASVGVGLLTWRLGGWRLALAGVVTLAAVLGARAGSLLGRVSAPDRTGRAALEALLVGAAYDVARAVALVARPSHDVRRRG
jgi:hypothetical protein